MLELITVIWFCLFWFDHWQLSSNVLFNGHLWPCRGKKGLLNRWLLHFNWICHTFGQIFQNRTVLHFWPNPQRISEETLILAIPTFSWLLESFLHTHGHSEFSVKRFSEIIHLITLMPSFWIMFTLLLLKAYSDHGLLRSKTDHWR